MCIPCRHFFEPNIPDFKGLLSFPRPVIHSNCYREPEPFADKEVLVIGVGPSGLDIMLDITKHAKVVYLSSRREYLKTKVPDNMEWLPDVSELKENGRVCFENGEERSVDCVVLATGYLYSYPFLSEESGIKVVEGKRVADLYKHTFNVTHPSMAVVGVNTGYIPFPSSDLQVQWILAVWSGAMILPPKPEMIQEIEDIYKSRLEEGLSAQKAGHYLQEKQWELYDQFASLGGLKPMPPVIKKLYNTVCQIRKHQIMDFRENNYQVDGEDSFFLKNYNY